MFTRIASVCLLSSFVFSPSYALTESKSPLPQKVVVKTNLKLKKLNFNTASASEISQAINGIGLKRAEKIIEYRKAHGNFKSFADLAKVKGISKRFMTKEVNQFNDKFFISLENKKS